MQITPEDKSLLSKYTQVAKKIIYDPQRMKAFMKMLGTKEGALTAVHAVVAAVDKMRPIPPQLRAFLGVNAYVIMVDVAQEATGGKPDPKIMQQVVGMIIQESQGQPSAQPAEQPAPDQGMLAQMQAPPGAPMPAQGAPAPMGPPQGGMLANMQRGVPA